MWLGFSAERQREFHLDGIREQLPEHPHELRRLGVGLDLLRQERVRPRRVDR